MIKTIASLIVLTFVGCSSIHTGAVDQLSDRQVEQFFRESQRIEIVYDWQPFYTNLPKYSLSFADRVRLSDPWCVQDPKHGFYSIPKATVVLRKQSHIAELMDSLRFVPKGPCDCAMQTTFRIFRGARFLEVEVSPHTFEVRGERFVKQYETPQLFYDKVMSLKPAEEVPNQAVQTIGSETSSQSDR